MRPGLSIAALWFVVSGCSSTPSSPIGGGTGGADGGGVLGAGGLGSSGGVGAGGVTAGTSGTSGSGGAPTGSGGTSAGAGGAPEIPDAAAETDGEAPARDFLTVTELARGQKIVVEKVTYASGPLQIFGQVCRPDDGGAHPVILVNHGGFAGSTDELFKGDLGGDSFCLNGSKLSYVIAESSYRGEDGSDGKVEVCLGEVDDVIALLGVLRTKPYVDPDRIGAFGGSHGGCITTSVALREPTLKAAVDFFGPSDLGELTKWWHDQLDQNEPAPFCASVSGVSPCTAVHQSLIATVETAVGRPPSATTDAAYRSRSPYYSLSKLAVPMVFIQGTDDYLVNLEQTCNKRSALVAAGHPPDAWYLDTTLTPKSPSTVCSGGYRTDPVPDTATTASWTGDGPYLFVYEGQGHGMTGAAQTQATSIALQFLFAHL